MASSGAVEDEIALRLGIDKNTLRAKYIADIKRGKALATASEPQFSRQELHAANAILVCFADNDWIDDGRSLLWVGLDGGGAKSAADAFAKWQLDGGRLFVPVAANSTHSVFNNSPR